MMNIAILLAILIGIVHVAAHVQEEPLTLKYASLIFRHGARSPTSTYPNDPYKEDDWPQGYGQLNWNGTRQHYQLGRLIKQRYTVEHQLLSSNYTRDEVYVRSTDFDRTLMSVLSQLSGLFPPEEDRKLNGTIDWQPIPVHTVSHDEENLLEPLGANCPRYQKLLAETLQTEYYRQVMEEHEQFFRDLGEATGENICSLLDVVRIADIVFIELEWGRNPGAWVNDSVIKTLSNLTDIGFYLFFDYYNSSAKQLLASGNLVKDIVERMEKKATDEVLSPGSNLKLYSAHDTTVAALLSALGIYDNIRPPYAATVFVELYSDSESNYFVRVWYLNNHTVDGFDLCNTSALLIPMTIPNCEQLCPLDKFIKLTAEVIPFNWTWQCNLYNDEKDCLLTKITGEVEHNHKRKRTTLTFSSDDDLRAKYLCKLNKGEFQDCVSPMVLEDMTKGSHTVTVKAFCHSNGVSVTTGKDFQFQVR